MALNYQAAVNITANFTGQAAIGQAQSSLNSLSQAAKQNQTVFGTLQGTITGMNGAFSQVGSAVKGFAAAFAVKEISDYVLKIINLGDELEKMHEKTGIGVEALSALKGAAEANGIAFDSIQPALTKFSANIAKANSGNTQAQAGFKSLHLSLVDTNGQLKPTGDLILSVADKFSKMKDGPNKAAIAVALFGKAGADLIPILNEGSESIAKYQLSFPDQFTERAKEFKETFGQIGLSAQQTGIDIVAQFLPALNEVIEAFQKITSGGTGETTKEFFTDAGEAIRQIGVVGIVAFEAIGQGFSQLITLDKALYDALVLIVDEFKDLGSVASAAWYAITGQTDKAKQAITAYTSSASGDLKKFYEDEKNLGTSFLSDFTTRAKNTIQSVSDLEKHSKLIGDGQNPPAKKGKDKTGDNSLVDTSSLKTETEAIQKLKDQQEELQQLNDLDSQYLNKSNPEYQKKVVALQDELAAKKELLKFNPADTDQISEYKKQAAALDEIKQKHVDIAAAEKYSFGDGAKKALQDYADQAAQAGTQIQKVLGDAFKGAEDALVSFIKTGKLSFADLASAIEDDLLHIAVRQTLVLGLKAAFGGAFAMGGIMTASGPVPLQKYASGGIATSPQLAMFGEGSTPEAYVPLPDGRSIPVTMQGGSGSSGTTVQVNVNIYKDNSSDQSSSSDNSKGQQLGTLLSAAIKQQLINEKRPGGLLA